MVWLLKDLNYRPHAGEVALLSPMLVVPIGEQGVTV